MANKFTVQVTNEGIDLMQDSIKNGKVLQFKTVTGSSTAFSDSQLATLSMSNYESIAKNQTGNVSSLENKDGVSNLEIVLDGSTVTNDYTLNSVWVLAQHENEPLKVFAVIKVNTELMVNAYEGDGATNIQINVGIKLDTSQVKMDIKSPGLATVQALELAKEQLNEKIDSNANRLSQKDEELAQKISDEKQEKNSAIQEVKDSLSSNISNLDSDIENAKEELNAKIQANSSKNSELEEKINVEKSRALEKEGQLATDLEQETSNRKTSDNDLKKLINDGINTLTNKINPLIDYPRTNGRDLNDFRNNGIWTVLTGFDGKDVSMRHYPQGLTNGALLVFRTNGDAVQGQVLLNTDTKRIYIRQYFGNNGWSEWVETATRQDIQNVETKITNVDNKITNVNNKLTEEQKYRNDGDSRLNDKLTQEVQTRKTETSSLNDKFTAVYSTLSKETSDRANADDQLKQRFDEQVATLNEDLLNINNSVTEMQKNVDAVQKDKVNLEARLTKRIGTEISDRKNADSELNNNIKSVRSSIDSLYRDVHEVDSNIYMFAALAEYVVHDSAPISAQIYYRNAPTDILKIAEYKKIKTTYGRGYAKINVDQVLFNSDHIKTFDKLELIYEDNSRENFSLYDIYFGSEDPFKNLIAQDYKDYISKNH